LGLFDFDSGERKKEEGILGKVITVSPVLLSVIYILGEEHMVLFGVHHEMLLIVLFLNPSMNEIIID
jgi:hypothetical protein